MALTDTAVRNAKPCAKDYTFLTTTASLFSSIRKVSNTGISAFLGGEAIAYFSRYLP